MQEIDRIFTYAVRAFIHPINENNPVAVIGIGFANRTYPQQVIKLLKEAAEKYVLHLEAGQPLLKITGSDSENDTIIFTVELNYLMSEFEEFGALVRQAGYGSFVIGMVHNGNFHIFTDDMEKFKPFNVSKFVISAI